ncbi:hypothetical protein C8J57DRAFT_1059005 [Mycena rebaudengoi]|nr:hypothetical protein C8J57DRAFT_1059005 [Mycena rebaudengoi]
MVDGRLAGKRTVVVLGAAYGGARAAQLIAAGLPDGWRIVLIDRNSYFIANTRTDVYILPRLAVLAGHEHKAFIPYDKVFLQDDNSDLKYNFICAQIMSLGRNSVTLSKAFPEYGIDSEVLEFDYAVYALGSHMPQPLNLWGAESGAMPSSPAYGGTKPESIAWLKRKQKTIEDASTVLVVGGGALGIQFASDIAAIHPGKQVTLLHSRSRLLPRFDEVMHTEILQSLESANVDVILGERVEFFSSTPGKRIVRTTTNREISADVILFCTGQRPNTDFLKALDASTVDPSTSLAHVLRTMQLSILPDNLSTEAETTPYPHIFVVGDAADAFGAIPAGHNAYYQAEVAARNILRLIRRDERLRSYGADAGSSPSLAVEEDDLELYTPGPPAIKVSLGLKKNVFQVNGVVGVGKEERDDLNAAAMWSVFGFPDPDEAQMFL